MTFRAFGIDHLVALCAIFALGVLIISLGRKCSPAGRRLLGYSLGSVLIAYVTVTYLLLWSTKSLSWEYSLPLELCHWVLAACLLSLYTGSRFAAEIAYFWGLAGTLQALLTPEISLGFPSWEFILFFWAHGAVILAIAFIVGVQKHGPRKGSIARMMLALNGYGLVAGACDAIFGWNYGYLRSKPTRPSMMDWLGPWPWYLLSLEGVAVVSFCILHLVWRLSRQLSANGDGAASEAGSVPHDKDHGRQSRREA